MASTSNRRSGWFIRSEPLSGVIIQNFAIPIRDTGNRIIGITITAGSIATVGLADRIRGIWGRSMATVFHTMVGITGGAMAPSTIAMDVGTEAIARIGDSDPIQMPSDSNGQTGPESGNQRPGLTFFCFGHPLRHGLY
jgi:hypothetical protein